MNKKLYACATILISLACNDGSGNLTDSDTTIVNNDSADLPMAIVKKDTTIGGCYTQIFKRDTVTLQVDITGNNATGPLTYKIYQKDMNDGSIKAELADSIIMGWYLFRSEGIMSVRQVAWRVKPGQLWPATGEIVQRNDTTAFADITKLRFDNTRPFIKVNCSL
jgi:hypothetical protein